MTVLISIIIAFYIIGTIFISLSICIDNGGTDKSMSDKDAAIILFWPIIGIIKAFRGIKEFI